MVTQEGAQTTKFIEKKDDQTFILNSAALSSISWRRQIASVTHHGVTSNKWISAIEQGMHNWGQSNPQATSLSQGTGTTAPVASTSQH
jgi:hypothetical protein